MKHRISISIAAMATLALGLTACATTSSSADLAAAQRRAAGQWDTSDRQMQAAADWGYARANEQSSAAAMSAAQQALPMQISVP